MTSFKGVFRFILNTPIHSRLSTSRVGVQSERATQNIDGGTQPPPTQPRVRSPVPSPPSPKPRAWDVAVPGDQQVPIHGDDLVDLGVGAGHQEGEHLVVGVES